MPERACRSPDPAPGSARRRTTGVGLRSRHRAGASPGVLTRASYHRRVIHAPRSAARARSGALVSLEPLPAEIAGAGADGRRRGVPGPARPRPARERPARPPLALDVPVRRPGRRPRGARATAADAFAGARRLLGRLAAEPGAARRHVDGDRAAVPRRARRLPRATTWASRSSRGATRRRGRPGPAAAPARPVRLGRGLGSAHRPRLARRPCRRRRRRPARPAPRRASASASARSLRARARRDARRRTLPDGPAVRLEPRPARVRGRRRGRPRRDRPRRDLPGEPHPAAADRRSGAIRGPLYRCLRTGDPALFAAYLDLGPAPATARRGRSSRPRRSRSSRSTRPAT